MKGKWKMKFDMKLTNDGRIAVIAILMNIVMLALFCAGWSAWVHLFRDDYLRNQKMKQMAAVPKFERPKPTPEQIAEFKRMRAEFQKRRDAEMKLRADLVTLLKNQKAPAAKIAAAECDLTLAKMRMMRRKRRSQQGFSAAEFVVRSYYAAKAAPAKVDAGSEESIRAAIADMEFKNQSGMLRRFMAEEEFKYAATEWQKNPTDANLKALCEAEGNVPEPAPRKRMKR